jgi:hypothetical protein
VGLAKNRDYPMKPYMLGVAVYDHVNESVLLSFSCSSFACGLYLCAEMSEYCGYCGQFVWPIDEPLEDWEVN